MKRGGLRSVPRMATRCLDTGTVSSAGVRPPGAEFVFSQWKEAQSGRSRRHTTDKDSTYTPNRHLSE